MDKNKLNQALLIINELISSKYTIDINDCYNSIINDKYFLDFTNINREYNEQFSISSLINDDYLIINQDEAKNNNYLYNFFLALQGEKTANNLYIDLCCEIKKYKGRFYKNKFFKKLKAWKKTLYDLNVYHSQLFIEFDKFSNKKHKKMILKDNCYLEINNGDLLFYNGWEHIAIKDIYINNSNMLQYIYNTLAA